MKTKEEILIPFVHKTDYVKDYNNYEIVSKDRAIEAMQAYAEQAIEGKNKMLKETAVRCRIVLPTEENEFKWWEEGTDHKKCGDFQIRLSESLEIAEQVKERL